MGAPQKLVPPCCFQGGKQRVAEEIVDYITAHDSGEKICDLCCGSGAVTLELVNRGFSPSNIVMCDISSWGKFWESIGNGTYSMQRFDWYCSKVPKDKSQIPDFLKELSQSSADEDEEYKYILLQAGSFGGKQIWRFGDRWMNAFFRSYWQPTEHSVRRSPVNPLQPDVSELRNRVCRIAERCVGLHAVHDDVLAFVQSMDPMQSIIYIDPPYTNTTGYGFDLDLNAVLNTLSQRGIGPVYISEKEALSQERIRLKFRGAKGGVSGRKPQKNEEWLSVFRFTENAEGKPTP